MEHRLEVARQIKIVRFRDLDLGKTEIELEGNSRSNF